MNNLDEDIEIVKENFDLKIYEKTNNVCKILDKNREIFPHEFIEDLIYIFDKLVHEQLKPIQLTACETLMERQKYEIQKAKDEQYEKKIEFLVQELETYKKIAKKLAEELKWLPIGDDATDFILFKKVEEAIDWARKEAEKDES